MLFSSPSKTHIKHALEKDFVILWSMEINVYNFFFCFFEQANSGTSGRDGKNGHDVTQVNCWRPSHSIDKTKKANNSRYTYTQP